MLANLNLSMRFIVSTLFVIVLVAAPAALFAQISAPAPDLAELQTQASNALDDGRHAGLDALAPKNFERARKAYDEAQILLKSHGDANLVSIKFKVALEEIEAGRKAAQHLREQVPTVLAARNAAREAGADTLVPAAWQRAEQQLGRVVREVEAGHAVAPTDADDVAGSYRAARRDALRKSVLDQAWELRDQIDRRKGEKLTPVMSLRVHQAISRAEAALAQENLDLARTEGANAARSAQRTLDIITHIERAQKSEAPWEAAVLPYDDALDTVAVRFDTELDYTNGVTGASQPLLSRINRNQDSLATRISELEISHQSLEQSLAEAQTSLADAQNRIVELERRMSAAEGERSTTRAKLQFSDQIARAQNHFGPGEASVRQTESGQVVMRLLAIRFAAGATKLDKAASKLLDKAAAAIGEFPGAKIAVEGHTDSDGGEQANSDLSMARATAVRNHLSGALKMAKDQITATGFGESRPIADNGTREGKAMNRRIEIVLTPQ